MRLLALLLPLLLLSSARAGEPLFTNSIGMKFVLIERGSFMMGSPKDEPQRNRDERRHVARLSKSYYLQTTELTQEQWNKVMVTNPARFNECGSCPVENVPWGMAQEFIKRLNRLEKTSRYRLPTEAEWEYAARAGTQSPFHHGASISSDLANFNGRYPYGGADKSLHRRKTLPVGSFKPNAWGLYDMHGNVWEWCEDRFGPYPKGPVKNPKGPKTGRFRVIRGGAWRSIGGDLRSALRDYGRPRENTDALGFRVATDSK